MRIDMLNKQFGKFKVIKMGELVGHSRHWILKCVDCGFEKSISGHSIRRESKKCGDKYGERCQGCIAIKRQAPQGYKHCLGPCGQILPLDSFTRSNQGYNGVSDKCKMCVKNTGKIIYEMSTGAQKRSKIAGTKCDVTVAYINELNKNQNGLCVYTGIPLNWERPQDNTHCPIDRASIDRKNSSEGYIKGNVQLVSYIANIMKNSFTEEEFLSLCKIITDKAIEDGKLSNEGDAYAPPTN